MANLALFFSPGQFTIEFWLVRWAFFSPGQIEIAVKLLFSARDDWDFLARDKLDLARLPYHRPYSMFRYLFRFNALYLFDLISSTKMGQSSRFFFMFFFCFWRVLFSIFHALRLFGYFQRDGSIFILTFFFVSVCSAYLIFSIYVFFWEINFFFHFAEEIRQWMKSAENVR